MCQFHKSGPFILTNFGLLHRKSRIIFYRLCDLIASSLNRRDDVGFFKAFYSAKINATLMQRDAVSILVRYFSDFQFDF